MRIILPAASFLALAACGPGSAFDNGFRESYVEKGIESCVAAATRPNPAAAGRVNYRRLCTCMMQRHVEGKSAMDLMGENQEQAGRQGAREMEQCIRDSVARGEIDGSALNPPITPAASGEGGKPVN